MGRLFLDANVPTYAAGRNHPLKEPCRELLRLVAYHPGAFFTDAEVLQEMLHRYLALRRWPKGKQAVLDFATLMDGSVEPVVAEDVVLACELADRHGKRLAARDLLHAAVAMRVEDASVRVVTADRDFDDLSGEGIERLDPADLGSWRHGIQGLCN